MKRNDQDVKKSPKTSRKGFLLVGISLSALLALTGAGGAFIAGGLQTDGWGVASAKAHVDNDSLFVNLPDGLENIPFRVWGWSYRGKDWHPGVAIYAKAVEPKLHLHFAKAREFPAPGAMSSKLGKTQNPECITVAPGDTLSELLMREAGLPVEESRKAIAAIERIYPAEKLQPGQRLQFAWAGGSDVPLLEGLTLELDDEHHVQVKRGGDGFQAQFFSPADAVIQAEADAIMAMVAPGPDDLGGGRRHTKPRFLTEEWQRQQEERGK
jgi:hypothetical protein